MNENLQSPAFHIKLINTNIIFLQITREFSEAEESIKQAEFVKDAIDKILITKPKSKFSLIADIRKTEESQNFYLKERMIYINLIRDKRISKIALITNLIFYKKLANIFSIIAGRLNTVEIFKEKNEAIEWIEKS